MGLSDHAGPLEVSGYLSLGLLLFGFAFEGQGLLELLRNVEGIEVSLGSGYRLQGKEFDFFMVGGHIVAELAVLVLTLHLNPQLSNRMFGIVSH